MRAWILLLAVTLAGCPRGNGNNNAVDFAAGADGMGDAALAADLARMGDGSADDLSAPPQAIFHSDWSTATGTGNDAFRDTGKAKPWSFHCCSSNTNTDIATAASLGLSGWPTPNAYRVGTQASSPGAINTHVVEVDLGPPSAGANRHFRYYLQVRFGDTHGPASDGNLEHGVETAESGGGDGMNFYRVPRDNGTWWPGYRETSTGVRYLANGLALLKNRTYRLEWRLAYGATTYTVQVRIYDDAGALVATDADFHRLVPAPESPSALLGAESFTYTPAHQRLFRVGTNGPNSNFPLTNLFDEDLFVHGAVAVCETDWCGPYRGGI